MSGNGSRIAFFSVMVVHATFAMDQLPIVRTRDQSPIPIVRQPSTGSLGLSSGSSGRSSPLSQSPGSGSYFNTAFNQLCNYSASGLKSLTETVSNIVSDEAAFRKLGWPLSDMTAKAELESCITKYEAYKSVLLNPESLLQECVEFESFVNRRREYLRRAIMAFSTLSNGIEFATHCLNYHLCIMHSFEQARIRAFLEQKQEASENASKTLKQVLMRSDGQ